MFPTKHCSQQIPRMARGARRRHRPLFSENEEKLARQPVHLNHYAVQSFDWFMQVKSKRGDSVSSSRNSQRDVEYFKRYDWNDIEDGVLVSVTRNTKCPSWPGARR